MFHFKTWSRESIACEVEGSTPNEATDKTSEHWVTDRHKSKFWLTPHELKWGRTWRTRSGFCQRGSLGGGLVLARNDWHKLSGQANAGYKLGFHRTRLVWLWWIHFLLTSFFSLTRLVVSAPPSVSKCRECATTSELLIYVYFLSPKQSVLISLFIFSNTMNANLSSVYKQVDYYAE